MYLEFARIAKTRDVISKYFTPYTEWCWKEEVGARAVHQVTARWRRTFGGSNLLDLGMAGSRDDAR